MRPIVRIRNLSKRYQLGLRGLNSSLRDAIADTLRAPLRRFRSSRTATDTQSQGARYHGELWALRDVTLEVAPGEVLGVVGRNGAGKSTLLKLLARITEPTSGQIDLYGRVGSLLEVGTGFHPELTGRDNIYLSAAILGMRRVEIERKFDEIIAFAEVERFIDTPVKRYSSGMFVRLAFAVAAHLDPEILLVDEVLAVGDIAFQKKCLGKIGEVARGGRTVLFVSHNTASIEFLCDSCLFLSNGVVEAKGPPKEIIERYVARELGLHGGSRSLAVHPGRRAGSVPTMTLVEVADAEDSPSGAVRMGSRISIRVSYVASYALRPVLGVSVKTATGSRVFTVSDRFCDHLSRCGAQTSGTVVCTIERLFLLPGNYMVDIYFGDRGEDLDVIYDATSFEVLAADLNGTGRLIDASFGPVFCPATWTLLPPTQGRALNGDEASDEER